MSKGRGNVPFLVFLAQVNDMDMSVKLNQVYSAPAVAETAPGKRPDARHTDETVKPADSPATDRGTLEQAVSALQHSLQASERQLDFSIDDATGQVVVKVIARQSGEVIRQLPSEEALKLAQRLEEDNSLLFTTQA